MGAELTDFQNISADVKARNPGVFGPGNLRLKTSSQQVSEPNTGPGWRDFESQVIRWLRDNGWKVAHSRPARVLRKGKETWETPLSGDKGFPDILAIKGKQCIVIEVKSGTGKASPAQVEWMLAFQRAGIPAFLVTPENWQQTVIRVSGTSPTAPP